MYYEENMSEDFVIKIEHLSKVYKIFDKPFDRVKEALSPFHKRYSKDFYALNDISFTVKKGETLGIIGKNGAGKSTLLKILTGVLTPSMGTIESKGKIASLLELGAGFNPEMTGVENIYLTGTLMGYKKREMDARLPDIVEFADIGDFIHQPIKMYSSGMFARLAFSVNMAVDPDILIVDEALAVGDFMFQFKCMQKFKELHTKGTTILFVSHSSQQTLNVCSRAIYMKNGKIVKNSTDIKDIIATYEFETRNLGKKNESTQEKKFKAYSNMDDNEAFIIKTNESIKEYRFGSHDAVIHHVVINQDRSDFSDTVLQSGKTTYIKYYIYTKREIPLAVLGMAIKDVESKVVWGTNTLKMDDKMLLRRGKNILVTKMRLNIVSGQYFLYCGLAEILGGDRIELDQRWPVEQITILSDEENYEGVVYSPIEFELV